MRRFLGLIILMLFLVLIILFNLKTNSASNAYSPSPTAQAQVTPAPSEQKIGIPKTLVIPKLSVTATIESVSEDKEGRMDIPKKVEDVAWFNLGFRPGQKGSAVIDGHLDTASGAPAVFFNLTKLQTGDKLEVTDEFGQTYSFAVTDIKTYPYDQLPLQEIFNSTDKPRLNLITCGGAWDAGTKNYSERIVVYSEIISGQTTRH